MESHHDKPVAPSKKPTQTEAVDNLISKKQAERAQEGARPVQESAVGVQTEVADVMGGVEGPKEVISEAKGESGEKGDIKGAIACFREAIQINPDYILANNGLKKALMIQQQNR